jgi:uncharacterized damage-inducible protein DinB
MDHSKLIDDYERGPAILRRAVAGLTQEQLDAHPVAGNWSIREVVCHLADAEVLYVERMKRVLVEDDPPLMNAVPDQFVPKLVSADRSIDGELDLIEAARKHMTPILRNLKSEEFQRTGRHSTDGPLTLETLLKRITDHVPHHVKFIDEKRAALTTASRQ